MYLVLELVEGVTLGDKLGDPFALAPMEDVVRWMHQACDGVAAAHRVGVIHRDLKPANILVTPNDVVKVIDFGIAKLKSWISTANEHLFGTALYMAPEQLHARPSAARADVYSTWASSSTRRSPECTALGLEKDSAPTVFKVVQQHLLGEPRPLQEVAPEVPADLAALVQEALAKDPERRVPSVRALADGLYTGAPRDVPGAPRDRRGASPPWGATRCPTCRRSRWRSRRSGPGPSWRTLGRAAHRRPAQLRPDPAGALRLPAAPSARRGAVVSLAAAGDHGGGASSGDASVERPHLRGPCLAHGLRGAARRSRVRSRARGPPACRRLARARRPPRWWRRRRGTRPCVAPVRRCSGARSPRLAVLLVLAAAVLLGRPGSSRRIVAPRPAASLPASDAGQHLFGRSKLAAAATRRVVPVARSSVRRGGRGLDWARRLGDAATLAGPGCGVSAHGGRLVGRVRRPGEKRSRPRGNGSAAAGGGVASEKKESSIRNGERRGGRGSRLREKRSCRSGAGRAAAGGRVASEERGVVDRERGAPQRVGESPPRKKESSIENGEPRGGWASRLREERSRWSGTGSAASGERVGLGVTATAASDGRVASEEKGVVDREWRAPRRAGASHRGGGASQSTRRGDRSAGRPTHPARRRSR